MVGASKKQFIYKVYSVSGTTSTLIGSWNDVIGFPKFEVNINGGMSQCSIMLARKWSDFGETQDISNGNLVKIYVNDRDTGDDDSLFLVSGYISGYAPILTGGDDEMIEVVLLGNSAKLQESVLTASGNTLVSFHSIDPSSMLASVVNLYNTTVSGAVTFGTSIDYSGSVASYDFDVVTYKQAIDKILQLAPNGWFYRIDPDDTIHFHPKRYSADHTLVIGKNIVSIEPFKNIEDIVNIVYFKGNGIQSIYRNETSIIIYGEKTHILQDNRVTVQASADILASSYLNSRSNPEVRTKLRVLDNNGDDAKKGYDIDRFNVGDMVSIIHPDISFEVTRYDEAVYDESYYNGPIQSVLSTPMQIVRLSYFGDSIQLELSSRIPEVAKRLEEINRNLQQYIQSN